MADQCASVESRCIRNGDGYYYRIFQGDSEKTLKALRGKSTESDHVSTGIPPVCIAAGAALALFACP